MAPLDHDEAGVDELLEVMRERRLRHREQRDQFALAHLDRAAPQHVEDVHAHRLGQRARDLRNARGVQGAIEADVRRAAACGGGAGRERGK